MENTLWYRRAARNFNEALPIANGHLGAMVYGGVETEHLSLNDDTLWSGSAQNFQPAGAPGKIKAIQAAVESGDYHAADELAKKLQGPYTGSFLPMADLWIDFSGFSDVREYRRCLDLDSALAHTEFIAGGNKFRREYFAENPTRVLLMRVESAVPGAISCRIRLTSQLRFEVEADSPNSLWLRGEAPYLVDPSYYGRNRVEYDNERGMRFALRLELLLTGGASRVDGKDLVIKNADSVEIRLASATGFRSAFDAPSRDMKAISERALSRLVLVREQSFRRLRSLHLADYRLLYGACSFQLSSSAELALRPTDERLRQFDGTDVSLAALLFNYGRYLLIASSRRGSQPANLQGIWNEELRAPWSSNYTININTQMNYWPAEMVGLGGCAEPLFRLIENLSVSGRRSAANYGCGGWVAHHNTDIWALSTMVGMGGTEPLKDIWWEGDGHIPQCVTWPMGGAWLCRHLYEHYLYTGDLKFLREQAYPLLRGAAEFMLDFLRPLKLPEGEFLATIPSTSPENLFLSPADGKPAAVSAGSAMDRFILHELFEHTASAAERLKIDAPLVKRLRAARERLQPFRIDPQTGRLCEWSENFDDAEVGHRHVSHLYGLHPSAQITDMETPELFHAARRTLEVRGDDGTGWSLAWKINFWARLLDGNHAWTMLKMMFRLVKAEGPIRYDGGGGVYANMFDAHPPFQIDGNFGVVAGMVEMLVQCHAGYIFLLPALPADWPEGELTNVRLRGGAALDIAWKKGVFKKAQFRPSFAGSVRFRSATPLRVLSGRKEIPCVIEGDFCVFDAEAGVKYQITPAR